MSSNSNNIPVNELETKKDQSTMQDDQEEPLSPSDFETVHRSGIDILIHQHDPFALHKEESSTYNIPSLPCDLPFQTIITKFTDIIDLHNSINTYFDEQESVECSPDQDPRYCYSKFYGKKTFNSNDSEHDHEHEQHIQAGNNNNTDDDDNNNNKIDESSIVFMINIYRNENNDSLHLELTRLQGCGIRFSKFFKSFAKAFAINKMDIWTFKQPHLCSTASVDAAAADTTIASEDTMQ